MSKIEEAIEDVINGHLSGMDFTDMITSEVRDCWDMDELDRVDEIADAVESLENNLDSATLENMDNRLSLIEEHVNEQLNQLREEVREQLEQNDDARLVLGQRIIDLEDRLNDYEEIREMAWNSANKSFFKKLFSFFRGE